MQVVTAYYIHACICLSFDAKVYTNSFSYLILSEQQHVSVMQTCLNRHLKKLHNVRRKFLLTLPTALSLGKNTFISVNFFTPMLKRK